ncbi:histidine kinase [Streptomyces sp. T-3]|nr:histidine kinase [Streptomyces sp. T-3]
MSTRFPLSTLSPLFDRSRALWTIHPYVVDIALAAVVTFAVSVQHWLPESGGDEVSWPGFALGVGTAVPLVWRRRAPFLAACAVTVFSVAMAFYHRPPPDVAYGGLVALYTVSALARPWQRRAMLVGWIIGSSLTMTFREHAEPFEYVFHLLSFASAYGLGVLSRTQRAYARALEDRARLLERERAHETAQAVAQERSRIARDMHDILAHAVSLMVVQAEAGPVVVRSDPARAEAAFDAIAASGRDAMVQLRRILGVLKDRAPGLLVPQPNVAALPELVRQVGRAGLRVSLCGLDEARPLHPDVEVAAYRVVQEALTNTVKHARATVVGVQLRWGDEELVITVEDDGRVAPGQSANGGGGHGLIGIRERAVACGGSAEAGPVEGGGFRVVARLPVSDG